MIHEAFRVSALDLSIKGESWKSPSSIDEQAAPRIERMSTVYSLSPCQQQRCTPGRCSKSAPPFFASSCLLVLRFCLISSARLDHDTHTNTIITVQSFISDGTSVMNEAKSVLSEGTNLSYGQHILIFETKASSAHSCAEF